MAKKTEKPKVEKPKKPAKPAMIPAAIRQKGEGMPSPPAVPADPMARLAQLQAQTGSSGVPEPKGKKKKTERPQIYLHGEAAELFRAVVPAKGLFDRIKSFYESRRGRLDGMLKNEYLRLLWTDKTQPENPQILVDKNGMDDLSCLWSFVAKWHVEPVQCKEGESPADKYVEKLVKDCKLDEARARAMVETELQIVVDTTIPLSQLANSDNPTEKEAANKLLGALLGNGEPVQFTPAELKVLIRHKAEPKINKGFMDRICGYCETVDQVERILTFVFKPEWHMKSPQFGMSDTDQVRLDRMVDECRLILVSRDEEEDDDD